MIWDTEVHTSRDNAFGRWQQKGMELVRFDPATDAVLECHGAIPDHDLMQ
ncbi:MAG: hypothetical protein AAFU85_04060 [Planctomycetota bacterium]